MSAEGPQSPSQPELPKFNPEDEAFLADLNKKLDEFHSDAQQNGDSPMLSKRVYNDEFEGIFDDAQDEGLTLRQQVERDDDLMTLIGIRNATRWHESDIPELVTPAQVDQAAANAREQSAQRLAQEIEIAKYQQTHSDGGQSIDREE